MFALQRQLGSTSQFPPLDHAPRELKVPGGACAFAEDRLTASKVSSGVKAWIKALVVSVELLHRSISIRVEGYDIELVS